MSLSQQEQLQIARVVNEVIDNRLTEMTKEIIEGFVECLDWHNENFTKIMEAMNNKSLNFIEKKKREVITIRSQEYAASVLEKQAEAEKEQRVSERLGFVPKAQTSQEDSIT